MAEQVKVAEQTKLPGEVDPLEHVGKPLWCVYGFQHVPFLIHFMLVPKVIDSKTIIELYHQPKNTVGFGPLGRTLDAWRAQNTASNHNLEHWFTDQAQAAEFHAHLVEGI